MDRPLMRTTPSSAFKNVEEAIHYLETRYNAVVTAEEKVGRRQFYTVANIKGLTVQKLSGGQIKNLASMKARRI